MTDSYLEFARQLPPPTEQQSEAFVDYVASAHSWYKHLPLYPPGGSFVFYLDPNAGRTFVRTRSGRPAFIDKTEDDEVKWHYTWMTTADYHRKFGLWNYAYLGSAEFAIGAAAPGWMGLHDSPHVLSRRGDWFKVLPALGDLCVCQLTAFLHERMQWWCLDRRGDPATAFQEYASNHPEDADAQRYAPVVQMARAVRERDCDCGIEATLEAFHAKEMPLQRERIRLTLTRVRYALLANAENG